jgi:hypothetical protein
MRSLRTALWKRREVESFVVSREVEATISPDMISRRVKQTMDARFHHDANETVGELGSDEGSKYLESGNNRTTQIKIHHPL